MLVLLPVFLLIAAALAILVLQRVRPSIGYSWLIASIVSIITWVVILVYRWYPGFPVGPVAFPGWLPFSSSQVISFQFDPISWSYALALVALLVAFLLTAPSRLEFETSVAPWVSALILVSMGLLAVLAVDPLTLMLSWAAIDLIELAVVLSTARQGKDARQAVVAFSARITGVMVLVWAVYVSRHAGEPLTLTAVTPEVGVYFLLAAALRLGVIPLHLAYTRDIHLRRGFGSILRLVAPASSLVILSRLPAAVVTPNLAIYMLGFCALAGLYGSVMWLLSSDDLTGRPYWIIAFAGIAVGSAVRGYPQATVPWGITMLLAGGLMFLSTARYGPHLIGLFIGFISITGLPFSPAAPGFTGLVVLPFSVLDILFILTYAFILLGYLRHSIRGGPETRELERWVQAAYPVGLYLLIVSYWLIGIFGGMGGPIVGLWAASLASLAIALGSFAWLWRRARQAMPVPAPVGVVADFGRRMGSSLASFFRLDWVYQFITSVYVLLQGVLGFLTQILEGEGGLLWALVLVALLATLIIPGGIP
ncbi:MAG: hypothetical protein GYA17_05135 [Chloroflexi bacterium]|jgi:hypothetical protein|nr:hypothetical protein [Chloroflexota bacterium]